MKGLLLGVCVLFLVGCESEESIRNESNGYRSKCIDGVVYFYSPTANTMIDEITSPKFNADGSIVTCLDEESMIEWEEDLAFYEKNN